MKLVRSASLSLRGERFTRFLLDDRHKLRVEFLENDSFRLLLFKNDRLNLERSWAVCPGGDELSYRGSLRAATRGFTHAHPDFQTVDGGWKFIGKQITLHVDAAPFNLRFTDTTTGDVLLAGTPTGFLSLGRRDDRIWNLWQRDDADRFYGLGEKSGGLDHAGRRLEMRCLDAMGYDARTADPLYKHYPFLIVKRPRHAIGMFYDNYSPVVFDTGRERDNYHGEFFSWRAPAGDFDLYLSFAPRIKTITEGFSWLTGRTRMGPRWSLGYSGSTMSYTESPGAAEKLAGFVADCERHEIPCHSFQLSSGYTSIARDGVDRRYVFHWNRDKIPDPPGLAGVFHAGGQKLAANIKPVLLDDHPRFGEVQAAGLFVRDSEDPSRPALAPFWDGQAAHLDFTDPRTRAWWRQNVQEQLLDNGIDATWNDNNEYEIWDDAAKCRGASPGDPDIKIELLRPVQTLLMMQTSFRAQRKHAPHLRPFAISRSGMPGMQRYVQTWSGDNYTSWDSLRYNIRMGLNLSLSGMYNVGHDVGGFAGPRPDPELFVRWVQNGIFHPRFTIHSWNEDGSVTEPWMYPEHIGRIRAALRLRLTLAPYLYQLLHRAHAAYEPIIRPTFYDHEHDPNCFLETDDFMLGPSLLVASVVEPGATERTVYLPENTGGWVDHHTGRVFAGGRRIRVPVTLDSVPLFVKGGHALPRTTPNHRAFTDGGDSRELVLFPGMGATRFASYLYEDDGETRAYETGASTRFTYELNVPESAGESLRLDVEKQGDWRPPFQKLDITVVNAANRPLLVNDAKPEPAAYHF